MTTLELLLLTCLAICPMVIIFGPILYRILHTSEFNLKRDAISTLRDFESTKFGFLIWINLYMISQLMFTFAILPHILEVPNVIYFLGVGSIIFGSIAFVFVSTTYKHMYLIAISFLLTIFSMLTLSFYALFVDKSFAFITFLLGLTMLSFLAATALNRMRMWLAEYTALTCLCVWNVLALVKAI